MQISPHPEFVLCLQRTDFVHHVRLHSFRNTPTWINCLAKIYEHIIHSWPYLCEKITILFFIQHQVYSDFCLSSEENKINITDNLGYSFHWNVRSCIIFIIFYIMFCVIFQFKVWRHSVKKAVIINIYMNIRNEYARQN